MVSYLLHFFTAALYGFVGVYTGRDGGQLLLFLTMSHLGLHAVDEVLYCGHLEEGKHRNPISICFPFFYTLAQWWMYYSDLSLKGTVCRI